MFVRRPVAESAVVQVLLTKRFTHTGFPRLYSSDYLPLRCQITETAESFSGENGRL